MSTWGVTGVILHDLTIQHGTQGIANDDGTRTLTDSTVSGNLGAGGIINDGGTMTVIDSTVANNSAAQANGGIGGITNINGTMTVIASTVSGNIGATGADPGTGGIGSNGTATLRATIVAGNTGGNCGAADAASLQSAGYNLTSDKTRSACGFTAATDRVNKNPPLGHLAKNGGPTKTLLPAATSPADDVIPKPTTLRGVCGLPRHRSARRHPARAR